MNRRIFIKGGYQWSAMPSIKLLPLGPGRDLLQVILDMIDDEGQNFVQFNRELGLALGRKIRWVQYAIAELIDRKFLIRDLVWGVDSAGRTTLTRVLKVTFRPAGREPKPKPMPAANLAVLPSPTPHARPCAEDVHAPACSPPYVGNQNQDSTAVVADVGHGSPSSPTAEEKERLDAEALAAFQARFAAQAAPETPSSPLAPSAPPATVDRSSGVLARAGLGLAGLLRRVPHVIPTAKLEELAAQGDRASIVELEGAAPRRGDRSRQPAATAHRRSAGGRIRAAHCRPAGLTPAPGVDSGVSAIGVCD